MHRLALLLCLLVLALSPTLARGQAPAYAIEPLEDGLHRFVAGNYRSVFWVTSEGIVVIDPLSTEAATWLKGELEERFDVPVRYVIYSHNHYDHAYGGDVFDGPGVTFIAHELAAEDLRHSKADTRLPELSFNDELALRLNNRTLRLRYHGVNNGRGSVSLHFEDHRVMFVVDWIVIGRMPWKTMKGYDIEGMIRSTRDVLALDWDTFVGGHAEIGTKDDVRAYLGYLESLYAQVRDGMQAGKTLEQLQREVKVPEYAETPQYDAWLAGNIEAVYHTLDDRSYMLDRPEVGDPEVTDPTAE